jgi:hypothetical protein
VRYLERVLEEEREARTEERRRHDTLMAQHMSRIPEIEAQQEHPETPETATEQPGRVGPQAPLESPSTSSERPSWWRRLIGG